MAYHEWPKSYGEYTFDWTAMKAGENDDMVARFLNILGNTNNLQMTYGTSTSTSTANTSRYRPTFVNMGYSCADLRQVL